MSIQPDVKFIHYRQRGQDGKVSPRGGLTIAFYEDGNTIYSACAKCHNNDNFNRKRGRKVATGRLQSPDYLIQSKGVTRDQFLALADEQVGLYNASYADQNLTREFSLRRPKAASTEGLVNNGVEG